MSTRADGVIGRFSDLGGKVVIVTGASRGIGAAAAEAFAAQGAIVEGCDRAVPAQPLGFPLTEVDVTDRAGVRAFVDGVVARHGGVDALINCAGVGVTSEEPMPVHLMTDHDWDLTLGINLTGTFAMCRAALPSLISRGGSIVNMSSIMGHVASAGASAYTASKGGVLGLTRTIALEYATDGVRANAVCPGYIDTPMVRHFLEQAGDPAQVLQDLEALHPVGRLGRPPEVVEAILWLASDASRFVTGSSLMVDGGYTAL